MSAQEESVDHSGIPQDRRLSGNLRQIREIVPDLKVIYTDVDGTLVGPGGCFFKAGTGQFSLVPAAALLGAISSGVEVVLVSGRNQRQLLEDARFLGLRDYIAEMGSLVVLDLGREVHSNLGHFPITDGTAFGTMLERGVLSALLSDFPSLEEHLPWSREREYTALFRGWVEVEEVNRYLEEAGWSDLVLVDNGRVGLYNGSLDRYPHAYHLVPRGVSKEGGVARHRELRGFPRSSAIAIGDAASDVAFASEVGAAFILANGLRHDPELGTVVAGRPNVFIADHEMGLGWAQVAALFVDIPQGEALGLSTDRAGAAASGDRVFPAPGE